MKTLEALKAAVQAEIEKRNPEALATVEFKQVSNSPVTISVLVRGSRQAPQLYTLGDWDEGAIERVADGHADIFDSYVPEYMDSVVFFHHERKFAPTDFTTMVDIATDAITAHNLRFN